MTTVGNATSIYPRWMEILDIQKNAQPEGITAENDVIVRANNCMTLLLNNDEWTYFNDIIAFGDLTFKPVDPKGTRPRVICRHIYVLSGKIKFENVQVEAFYRFQIPLEVFSRIVPKLFAERAAFPIGQRMDRSVSPSPTFELTSDVNTRHLNGITGLMSAAHFGDVEVAKLFLEARADVTISDRDDWTALTFAMMEDSGEIVRLLLQAKANIEKRDSWGDTLLHTAATHNRLEAAKCLVDAKAPVDALDGWNHTPLSNAARKGNVEILNLLVAAGADMTKDRPPTRDFLSAQVTHAAANGLVAVIEDYIATGGNMEAKNSSDETLLILAAKYGQIAVVDLLLRKGAKLDGKNREGNALTWAVRIGHADVVALLLNSQIPIERGHFGALRWAVNKDHLLIIKQLLTADPKGAIELLTYATGANILEIVKMLVEAGVDFNARVGENYTPFENALKNGHPEIIDFLIGRGANGTAGLFWSIDNRCVDAAEYLIDLNIGLQAKDGDGRTALMHAFMSQLFPVVKKLIALYRNNLKNREFDKEAPQNFCSERATIAERQGCGNTKRSGGPLQCGAGENENYEVKPTPPGVPEEHLVLGGGAQSKTDPSSCFGIKAEHYARDSKGMSVLMYAAIYGDTETIELLLKEGVAVNETDPNFRTALTHAAIHGRESNCRLLLAKGADFTAKDSEKRSPVAHAAKGGHLSVVRVLIEAGAEINERDIEDRSPIAHAAIEAHPDVVRLLLDKKADISPNKDHLTPFLYASQGYQRKEDLDFYVVNMKKSSYKAIMRLFINVEDEVITQAEKRRKRLAQHLLELKILQPD